MLIPHTLKRLIITQRQTHLRCSGGTKCKCQLLLRSLSVLCGSACKQLLFFSPRRHERKEVTMGFYSKIMSGMSKKNGKNSNRRIEGYFQACENLYNLCVSMYPGKDPHERLVIVSCAICARFSIFKKQNKQNPHRPWR